MKIRAKFTLVSHTHLSYGHGSHGHTFEFAPQYDTSIPEDQRFSKATPNGNFKMTVDNPPFIEYLAPRVGQQFYIDMIHAAADGA